MSRLSFVVSIALLASGSAAAVIVEQAKPAPTYEAALARSWEDVHNKILTMAKDTAFADDKLAKPGKCPACRGTRIYEPMIRIVHPE